MLPAISMGNDTIKLIPSEEEIKAALESKSLSKYPCVLNFLLTPGIKPPVVAIRLFGTIAEEVHSCMRNPDQLHVPVAWAQFFSQYYGDMLTVAQGFYVLSALLISQYPDLPPHTFCYVSFERFHDAVLPRVAACNPCDPQE